MRTIKTWLATIAVLLCSVSASAHDFVVNGIYYNITSTNEMTVSVTYEGNSFSSATYTGDIFIPATVIYNSNTYSVTSIGYRAFYGCSGLTSVTIPNSVTSIRSDAFHGCSGLTSVTIGNGVTSIGSYAFSGCSGLTSVTIPNSVTSIGIYAFYGCSGLTSVSIPNSVTSIGNSAFGNCRGLTSVTIPNSVTSIGNSAFGNCSGLTSVTIPNSVTSIGDEAFRDCSGLTSVTIPNSVTSIGNSAFGNCRGLTSVTIPNSVESIGDEAFSDCSGLTSVTIPNSVTSIGSYAFSDCSGLTSVTIPNSVTSIGSGAFSDCSGLTSVAIPNSVTSIGSGAFKGCSGLTSIVVEDENSVYDSRNNSNAIIETATNTLHVGCQTTNIPNSVTSIGDEAFAGCSGLTSIIIPNSVTSIGRQAFQGCNKLNSVNLPSSISKIYEFAFPMQENLQIHINDISVWLNIEFVDNPNSNPLYAVPASKLYIDNEPVTKITIPGTVKKINPYAFSGYESLTSVIIQEGVEMISTNAFTECINLISVTIPEGVSMSGIGIFAGCYSLENINLPSTMSVIPPMFFTQCTSLGSLTCSAVTPPTFTDSPDAPEYTKALYGVPLNECTLYVPAESISDYSTATGWSEFTNILPIDENIVINDNTKEFLNARNLYNVNITYTRTLPNLQWNALFVPFEIPVGDLVEDYDVAYINDIHSYDKDFNGEIDQMEMEVIYIKEGTLHANHPYLIRAKNDEAKEMSIVVTDATLYSSAKADRTSIACSSAYTDFEVIGTYEKMSAEELDGCYAISTSGAWSPIASGASLNPFRLYMTITNRDGSPVKVSQSAQARINIRVQGEDNATGITETENTKVKTENFDLSGRRVERMQKGIYIVNGKKVVRY